MENKKNGTNHKAANFDRVCFWLQNRKIRGLISPRMNEKKRMSKMSDSVFSICMYLFTFWLGKLDFSLPQYLYNNGSSSTHVFPFGSPRLCGSGASRRSFRIPLSGNRDNGRTTSVWACTRQAPCRENALKDRLLWRRFRYAHQNSTGRYG